MPDLHAAPVAPAPEPKSSEDRQVALRAASVRVSRGSSSFQQADETVFSQVKNMFSSYAPMSYYLPWEILEYLELLSVYNPDFSQAVENLRTLANSGHDLFVDAATPDLAAEIKDRLEEKARQIKATNGGMDGLMDQLFDMAAVYGAMCGEWVTNESLDDVVDFVEVNPKLIRFFWSPENNTWEAYQKVSMFQAKEAEERGQQVRNLQFVRLNPDTFSYYAFDAAPGSPYGVPPFTGALVNIAIQREMVINMSQIVKKIGILGVIDFVIQQLPRRPGEDDDQYASRANSYLDSYVTAIEQMTRDGGIVHFNDSEAKTYNIAGNAAGATAIFKQNEELIFSGLKSMPSVQGRSYSTTETYAGVAYDIIIRNTKKYQKAVKRMVESGYWMMALTWGYGDKVTKIQVNWHSNKTLHRLQDAQSELLEIKNSLMLWAMGIIDQLDVAQRHGKASVKREFVEPPSSQLLGNGSPGGGAGNTSTGDDTDGDTSDDGPDGDDKKDDNKQKLEMPVEIRNAIIDLGRKVAENMELALNPEKDVNPLDSPELDPEKEAIDA